MSFLDFYSDPQKFVCSIEVFPPRSVEAFPELIAELQNIQNLKPAFVSVTYGAMGSTRALTADLALLIQEKTQIPTAFHLTCVGLNRDEIHQYVTHLKQQGLRMAVALRGDLPAGQPQWRPAANGFAYANELVAYLKSLLPLSLAVAGYPEKHKEAHSFDEDLQNLKRKVDAGADVVLTQLFFDNADFYRFVEKARKIGIAAPIVPGLMPIQNLKQIQKITSMCGAKIPQDLQRSLETHQHDAQAIKRIGIEHATKQTQDLKGNSALGVHFFCLNRTQPILEIMNSIG